MIQHHQEEMFYEDLFDALRAAIQAAGGAKSVAGKLWPKKPVPLAHRDLLDALNRDRERKLDPEEVLQVFRIARDAGFHSAFHFMCDQAGYHKPAPVTSEEQAIGLAERVEGLTREVRAAARELERLNVSGALRQFPKSAT